MHTADNFVTSSASAIRLGTGPNGSFANVVSRPARITPLAEMNQLQCERDHVVIEELHLIEPDNIDLVNLSSTKKVFAQIIARGSDNSSVMSLLRVTGDRCPVIAKIDVGLVAGNPLASNTSPLEPANELL